MSLGTAGYVCTWQIHVGRSDVTDKRPGYYVRFKMAAAMLNFGLLWRGISVGSDTL